VAEGRGSGIPKIRRSMRDNGSPDPRFDFDPGRSYFRVTLPAHPEYVALSMLREYAYRKATGDASGAHQILERAWTEGRRSPSLAVVLIRDCAEHGDLDSAKRVAAQIPRSDTLEFARALTTFATALAEAGQEPEAKAVLDKLPLTLAAQDAFEAAIAERRLGRHDRAHRLFERAGDLVLHDARALHEFAQTKMYLTRSLVRLRRPADLPNTWKPYAVSLLRPVTVKPVGEAPALPALDQVPAPCGLT
jgi:ATP-dependent DNA helicase RecG